MKSVLDIQARLLELGYDPGPIDGVRGRQTIAAVKRFQTAMHLYVDGLVGPQTLKALFGETAASITPAGTPDATPWINVAERMKGLRETNQALKDFLKSDGGTVGDPSRIPWCGDFVATCIAIALPEEALPSNPYGAINWLKFGKPVTPKRGAVLIFWRGSPNGWQGHVGFYVGEDATHYHVLGGNQSDMVNVSRIAKNRLRAGGCRWPLTALDIETGAVQADGSHLIETKNEE
jgi:uncharacterized protein (TIGR02594 family)